MCNVDYSNIVLFLECFQIRIQKMDPNATRTRTTHTTLHCIVNWRGIVGTELFENISSPQLFWAWACIMQFRKQRNI